MSDNIPHEIVVEILTNLPTKSLMKFKCVSKLWHSVLTDPTFIKKHLNRSIETPKFDLIASKIQITTQLTTDDVKLRLGFGSPTDVSLPFHQLHMYHLPGDSFDKIDYFGNPYEFSHSDESILLGSCNGIVCLANCQVICLRNPCTRENKSVIIGKKLYASERNDYYAVEVNAYGFGYDRVRDDYKCVQLMSRDVYPNYSEFNVFSMKNGSRKTIRDVPYDVAYAKELGVFVSGALHWVVWVKKTVNKVIVAFDIEKNVFREVPSPTTVDQDFELNLGLLQGQLCVLRKYVGCPDIDIWVMKNYGVTESWSKIIKMELVYPYDVLARLTPLGFGKNGEIVLKSESSLDLYDPKNKTLKQHLGTHGTIDWMGTPGSLDWSKVSSVVAHVDSLVSLKSYVSRA
ncbi:hypothetical protein ACHQM5_020126 [Ranunculus cassubicifolius]